MVGGWFGLHFVCEKNNFFIFAAFFYLIWGGVTQDVGSGTIGVKKCGKWDYRGEKMWEVGLSL